MTEQSPTPDGQVEASPQGSTPPVEQTAPEQAAQAAFEAAADQSVDTPDPRQAMTQAEYTRAQQAFSVAKQELGLSGKATREEVIAAIQRLKDGGGGEIEDEEVDPRVAEADQRAWEYQARFLQATYPEIADQAIAFIDRARREPDVGDLVTELAALVEDRVEARMAALQQAPGTPSATPAAPAPPDAPPVPESGVASDTESEAQPRTTRDTAVVSAVRGLFAAAAQGRQPPS